MPATSEEITGTYCHEQRRFDNVGEDVVIGDVTMLVDGKNKRVTVIGPEDDGEPTIGGTYRFYGRWQDYKNRYKGIVEKQFRFQTFVPSTPHNRLGVVNYLKQAPGLGDVLASRLFDTCGASAVQFLRESPDKAASRVQGLSLSAAKEAAEWLEERQAIENCMIDVMELLAGRGFRQATAKQAIKVWGNRASEIIRRDPYSLMRFPGCGFKLCDTLHATLGLPSGRLKRQALCAWYAIASGAAGSGDTWHYHEVARRGLKSSIGGTEVRPEAAIRLATKAGILSVKWTDGQSGPIDDLTGTTCWLAESRKARSEAKVAKYVAEAMEDSSDVRAWPLVPTGIASSHQIAAIHGGTPAKIGLLIGSPGTGKTFAAAQLVKEVILLHGGHSIAIGAPTGKAAVRITEAMQAYGIPLRAKTIHSLLQVERGDSGEGWSFKHGRKLPLPYRFIVVDEASMLDTDLMASLLAARHRDCSILFVGDVNQLPPVGHGAPLRDFIAAGLPCGELREIRRNSGMIVEACAAIRDNERWYCLDDGRQTDDDPLQNLICMGGESAEIKIELLKERLLSLRDKCDPIWDCQVLVAVNKKSQLARKELNPILQDLLNPNPKIGNWPFRIGDKVVCLSNGFYSVDRQWKETPAAEESAAAINERGEAYVANGEIGRVVAIEEKRCVVELPAPVRQVVVHKAKSGKQDAGQEGRGTDAASNSDDGDAASESGAVGNWDLAYALSVWKAQGSEWPIVFVMLDDYPGAMRICTREYIYTAISRAKQCCFLVGNDAIARRFCKSIGITKRKTFLRELISGGGLHANS